jgi:DNA polymerase III epsilon subunit-like protein
VLEHKDPIESSSERAAAEKRVESLIATGDDAGLMEFAYSRSENLKYREALGRRDAFRSELAKLNDRYQIAKGNVPSAAGVKKKDTFVAIREATLAFRDVFEKNAELQEELNIYRELSAQAAAASSRIREDRERKNGTFLEFTADSIGDLVAIGEHESGSDEWHASRAEGIGGSDVGPIMRVDKHYASVNYRRVLLAKLGEAEEVAPPIHPGSPETTAIGRGNAWEEALRQRCADENPDLYIAFCKTSWAGVGKCSFRRANFDGLILNSFGVPVGVVEVKTSSDRTQWGNVSDGIWAVPAGYRKQVLWYAVNANLKWGKIVVLIDDYDYREYDFDMADPKVIAEVQEILKETDAFWAIVIAKRAAKAAAAKLTAGPRGTRIRGFGAIVDYERVATILSAYSDEDPAKVRDRVLSEVAALEEELGRPLDADENQTLLVGLFAEHNPALRHRPLIGVDIETSRASPRTGRIIETGIVELKAGKSPKIVYSELHGVSDRVLRGTGVGFKEVHGISPEDLNDKMPFEDADTQKLILEYLKSGIMTAHNAGFEDRFFVANLDGYAEARDNGEIILLDTRILATMLMPETADSSLNSFAEDNGIPYEGAHAASADALMMMKALQNLQRILFNNGRFKSKRVTTTSRRIAALAAIQAESRR